MRVLVAGSRTWGDEESVSRVLQWAYGLAVTLSRDQFVVVEGCCPTGADRHATNWVTRHTGKWNVVPMSLEHHPPKGHGSLYLKQRNVAMADSRPDLAFVFMKGQTPGSMHMIDELALRGVTTYVVPWTK